MLSEAFKLRGILFTTGTTLLVPGICYDTSTGTRVKAIFTCHPRVCRISAVSKILERRALWLCTESLQSRPAYNNSYVTLGNNFDGGPGRGCPVSAVASGQQQQFLSAQRTCRLACEASQGPPNTAVCRFRCAMLHPKPGPGAKPFAVKLPRTCAQEH